MKSNAAPRPAELSPARPALAERHLQALHDDRAVQLEVIAERGYRTVTDRAELLALGFADYQARVPALLVPLHGVDGSNGRFALKPDHPRERGGRTVKYDYPAGSSHMLDIPPRCLPALLDPSKPLLFTEGAAKADCAAGLGHCAVNIWGTSAWYRNPEHGGFITIEPLADWHAIRPTLDGRICYLAYDSDAWRNPNVARELRRLANWLARQGALVYIIHLPDEPDGGKNGLDDFVARHGAEAFALLVEDAEPWGSIGMVRKLRADLQDLRAQRSAEANVLRNPGLRPTDKVVAIAAIRESGWRESTGAETPFAVNCGRLGEATGLGRQTVGRSLETLAGPGGIFDKRVSREFSDEFGWRSVVKLTPRHQGGVTAMLQAAATCAPERKAWGGHRPRCPDHPLADVVERRVQVCAECGQLIGEPTERILKLQDATSDAPTDADALKLQVVTSEAAPGDEPSPDPVGLPVTGITVAQVVTSVGACRWCGFPSEHHRANPSVCARGFTPRLTEQRLGPVCFLCGDPRSPHICTWDDDSG